MSAELVARIAGLEARVAQLESKQANGGGAVAAGEIASDIDLDGPYGDPVVKYDPKRWIDGGKPSYAGCKMSECPSAYLLEVASYWDWKASKDEEEGKTYTDKKGNAKPTAPLNRKNASKARGWALRNKNLQPAAANGGGAAQAPEAAQYASDDDIPFVRDETIFGWWGRP